LTGRNGELLGALLVGSSRLDLGSAYAPHHEDFRGCCRGCDVVGLFLTWWVIRAHHQAD